MSEESVTPELVDITTVHTDAVKITADDLRVTDLVFDPHGDTHELASVRTLTDGRISFKRVDLPHREYLYRDDTITVMRTKGNYRHYVADAVVSFQTERETVLLVLEELQAEWTEIGVEAPVLNESGSIHDDAWQELPGRVH